MQITQGAMLLQWWRIHQPKRWRSN